jgi:hypothetical protein
VALGGSTKDYQAIDGFYVVMDSLRASDERPPPAHLRPLLETAEASMRKLAKRARMKKSELAALDEPLDTRLAFTRDLEAAMNDLPADLREALADPRRAAEALPKVEGYLRERRQAESPPEPSDPPN